MKITCISTSAIPSPTAHSMQLMKVCQALSQLGHQVELIVPGKEGIGWKELSAHYGLSAQFRIHFLSSYSLFHRYDFVIHSVRLAQKLKADLIYTWLLPVAVLSRKTPIVLELHDRISGKLSPWLFRRYIRTNAHRRLVLITHALKGKLEDQFGISLDDVDHVIAPNGVELERYAHLPSPRQARKSLGIPERLTVLYAGGFYAGRGIETLHYLAVHHPEIQFIWAGGTPRAIEEWQERLRKEGIKNVILPGFIPNHRLPEYQAAGDILVMPFGRMIAGSSGGNSADICSPMKMFDYLACGRAIMASDLPVLREVLNEQNALLLPADDPAAWDGGLVCLISNGKMRKTLGDQAASDATRYAWIDRERSILSGIGAPE